MRRLFSAALSIALLILASVVSLAPQRAWAATTYQWTGEDDGTSWNNEKNWQPEGVPEDGDSVIIEKNSTITGIGSVSLDMLSVQGLSTPTSAGPTLVGPTSTITAKVLTWTRGRIAVNLIVTQGGGVTAPLSGPPPRLDNGFTPMGFPAVTLTNNGQLGQSGTLGLENGAARVINNGVWGATGVTTISSSHCCIEGTGTFENHGDLRVDGTLTIDHARLQSRPSSRVNGSGTLQILGGVPEFVGPWSVGPDTNIRLLEFAKVSIQGTTTIKPRAQIHQEAFSQISGKGILGGSGTYRWVGGRIFADLTLAETLATVIDGSGLHELSSGTGAGVLTNEGTVTQKDDTNVLMNGNIVNKGTWRVPDEAFAIVQAGTCCAAPKKFRNEGTIKVEGTGLERATLQLGFLEYSNPADKGVIEGGGAVQLRNGIHQLRGGGTVRGPGTALVMLNNAEVHATGTLKLDQAHLDVASAALWGTFTIGGTGDSDLDHVRIYSDLTTGPDVTVRLGAGQVVLDSITGTGILRTKGSVVHKFGAPVQLVGSAQILNSGGWDMHEAVYTGTACCDDPATFVNEGDVTVKGPPDPGNPAATFSLVRFVNRGTTDVAGVARFDDLSPVQADGRMKLVRSSGRSSRITNELPLRVSGGVLQGHGQVDGDLRNAGTVSPGEGSTLGGIFVLGEYRQSGSGRLNLDVKGADSDEVVTSGGLTLAGSLRLSKLGSNPLGPEDRKLLSSSRPRTGRFDTVLGLGALGGDWRVKYMPKSVLLELA